MSRMQRLSSKINYDVLEKLFDESVCASPSPKFLENSIIHFVTFNFYSDVNSFGRPLFSSFKESSVLTLFKNKQNLWCLGWMEIAGV